jgi:hypothetical protein
MLSQATSFLNSTLFLHRRVASIDEFEPWMMKHTPSPPLSREPEPEPEPDNPVTQPSFQYRSRSRTDPLFWCVYAIHHQETTGVVETRAKEIEEKLAAVQWVNAHRTALLQKVPDKPLSGKRLQEHCAEIMSLCQTTWGALYLLCRYYGINVRVIPEGRNVYMDFRGSPEQPDVVYQIIKEKDTFHVNGLIGGLTGGVSQDFWQTKPLRAISHYNAQELHALATRLGLDVVSDAKQYKKQALYDSIYKELSW